MTYSHAPPTPLEIDLCDDWGWEIRQYAAAWLKANATTTGAERGSESQQGAGALAEMVVREKLGMSRDRDPACPVDADLVLASGVKVDVKCRGGTLPFSEAYTGRDGLIREAKHNLYARQVYDPNLKPDAYLMSHLRYSGDGVLPGTRRQRNWRLFVCGWVSKARAEVEGVFLPRGSMSERGNSWMEYRGQQVEFYNRNLNGLGELTHLLPLDAADIQRDANNTGHLHMTSADAIRVIDDLVGKGLVPRAMAQSAKNQLDLGGEVSTILHENQYRHLASWMEASGLLGPTDAAAILKRFPGEPFTGI